jgi:hypothetical protein
MQRRAALKGEGGSKTEDLLLLDVTPATVYGVLGERTGTVASLGDCAQDL